MMKIDIETLISSLNNLKITEDISWREIERQAGVFNVSRIVSGEIRKPTAESWWQLHRAFPLHIPEPSYLDGTKIYKNVSTGKNAYSGDHMEITNNRHASDLSPEEQTLINLLRKKDTRCKILERIIADLIMRETEDDKVI